MKKQYFFLIQNLIPAVRTSKTPFCLFSDSRNVTSQCPGSYISHSLGIVWPSSLKSVSIVHRDTVLPPIKTINLFFPIVSQLARSPFDASCFCEVAILCLNGLSSLFPPPPANHILLLLQWWGLFYLCPRPLRLQTCGVTGSNLT